MSEILWWALAGLGYGALAVWIWRLKRAAYENTREVLRARSAANDAQAKVEKLASELRALRRTAARDRMLGIIEAYRSL